MQITIIEVFKLNLSLFKFCSIYFRCFFYHLKKQETFRLFVSVLNLGTKFTGIKEAL